MLIVISKVSMKVYKKFALHVLVPADPFEQKVINVYVIKLITNVIHLPMYILYVTSRSFVTHTHACTHMCTHNKTVIAVSKVTMLISNVIHLLMYILCVTSGLLSHKHMRTYMHTRTHTCTHTHTHTHGHKTMITVSKVTMHNYFQP